MIINGKETAAAIRTEIAERTKDFVNQTGRRPGLAVVMVGENPASAVYVRNKQKACEEVGFFSEGVLLPVDTSETDLLACIERLNHRDDIDGILVQLPLPDHLSADIVINAISPDKDVDGFHPVNVANLCLDREGFVPCTPAGIIELLDRYGISIMGKRCVVIGRSDIVGKPVARLLLSRNGTVTICHSKTVDLSSVTKEADILIAAVGRPGFVTADMVKAGAVVIDVGINRNSDGKLCGDVCYDEVTEIASAITPVPGGVGPMTIAMLMKNTLIAANRRKNRCFSF